MTATRKRAGRWRWWVAAALAVSAACWLGSRVIESTLFERSAPSALSELAALESHVLGVAECERRSGPPSATCPPLRPEYVELVHSLELLDDLIGVQGRSETASAAERADSECLEAIRNDQRMRVLARLQGDEDRSGRGSVARACDAVVLPTLAPEADPFTTLVRTCGHALDADRVIDGPVFGECVRRVEIARLAAIGVGPPLPRPNVIVILTDDQRHDALDATYSPDPASGSPAMPATTARLVNEGITFTQAVVTTPVCGPSRGSFFTGRNTHRHRMLANGGRHGPSRFRDEDTFATRFHDAGYRTGFVGKYTNGFTKLWNPADQPAYVPPGWDDFRIFHPGQDEVIHQRGFAMLENGVRVSYGGDDAPYSTDVLSRQARTFIDRARDDAPDQPFALWISTSVPHYPWQPAERHRGAFANVEWPTSPSHFEADVRDKPRFVQRIPLATPKAVLGHRATWQSQLEMTLSVDEMVAALVDHLDELGIGDDTVIVYSSDNGHAWGEHRWVNKACPWEECLRVPMVIRYPRLVPGPRTDPRLVANVDVLPTLLGLAGEALDRDFDGVDLGDVLRGGETPSERDVLVETYTGKAMTYVALRKEGFKYVRYPSGRESLYDLERDPHELENWIDDAALADELAALRSRLDEIWPGFDAISRQ